MAYLYRTIIPRLCVLIFLGYFVELSAHAQSDTLLQHKIWVKLDAPLSPEVHQQLHKSGEIRTGKPSLDQLSQDCGVIGIRRVFSPTSKFEKAHEHYGLHLWYEVQFSDTLSTPASELAALFCTNAYVTAAEAIPVRMRYAFPIATPLSDTLSWGNDPRYEDQWHFNNTGQSGGSPGADIRLASAWPLATGDSNVIVAVIDGGIDGQHEDLKGALWVNQLELQGDPKVDDDGNGYVDDVHGYGFGDKRGTIHPDRHGTHVAGTLGAVTNNGVGVSGVAGGNGSKPGVRLMSCAVFGKYGQGSFPEAFVYAADNGAVIAQNSWGGGGKSQVLEDAIRYFVARAGYDNTDAQFDRNIQTGPMAGGLVIFAAGNDNSRRADLAYPASLESVLSVTSLDHEDKKSDFANYGDWVDIAAPGSEILSTFPDNNYGYLSGTSMACPQVAGVAALAVSRFQRLGFTQEHLRRLLLRSVDAIDAVNQSFTGQLGSGRINAYKVLTSDTDRPPAAITDLASSNATFHSVTLSWTATGADGIRGTAAQYELRVSTDPITKDNINQARTVASGTYPSSAGTIDSAVVTGLRPATSYYFALIAVDLPGHRSPLSNVIKVITREPPHMRVQPAALTATVPAREKILDTLTIDNSLGKSPLSYWVLPESGETLPDWLRLPLDSGVVAAGASQSMRLTWDARSLSAGDYRTRLQVMSNDPDNPTVEVPVQLMVTGTPAISPVATSLDFGNVYLSFPKSISLTVRNVGTDILRIEALETDTMVFRAAATMDPMAPGEEQILEVTFTPSTVEEHEATLIIHSNDPRNPSYAISLSGKGLMPPPLLVNPAEVTVELVQEEIRSTRVRLQNSSFTNSLEWSVHDSVPAWLTLSSHSGRLAPRAEAELTLTLSAKGGEVGHYAFDMNFRLSEDASVLFPVALEVVAPNQAPVWADSLLEFRVHIDEAEAQFNLAEWISDQEGDALRFDFHSEGTATALVQVVGSVLTLTPERVGVVQGTITALDAADNLSEVAVSIEVLPPNRPPESVNATVAVEVRFSDQSFEIDLDSLFFDPDADALVYSFGQPTTGGLGILEDSVVRLTIQGQRLIGQTNALGRGKVVVYAYDPAGTYTTTTLTFTVLPPNQAPLVQQRIDAQQLVEQGQYTVSLSTLFADPDGDTLVYQAEVADTAVARVSITAATLRITGLSSGETSVTVTAQDEAGEKTSFSFHVTVARVTSVVPVSAGEVLRLYPNPASDWVTVAHPQIQKLRIYDPRGRLLYEEITTSVGEISFSVATLPQGVYQVVVFTHDGQAHRTSLIRE